MRPPYGLCIIITSPINEVALFKQPNKQASLSLRAMNYEYETTYVRTSGLTRFGTHRFSTSTYVISVVIYSNTHCLVLQL